MNKDKARKIIKGTAIVFGAAYAVMDVIAHHQKKSTIYADQPDQQNPMQGKKVEFVADENDKENADGERGHLEAAGDSLASTRHQSVYEKVIKRGLDKALSFGGLVLLSPLMGSIALAIKIEDPGPTLFTQKRVGQDKRYFKLHKFRSMKMSTPHDVPTHMLENPESYITKVGGFLRKHSLDELPQIWDIFVGNMSVIGPRPALWNQDVLVAERDKVGANDVKPGLTGWAQINGRDELEIPEKAALDGVYTKELEKGGIAAAKMDAKCFAGSIHVFGSDDTVVEGGTGTMAASSTGALRPGVPATDPTEHFACDYTFTVDHSSHKNVLIVGTGSYIGESFVTYAKQHYSDNFTFTVVDTMPSSSDGLSELDKLSASELGKYDIVYHLAGIAHADVGNVSEEVKEKYYKVNTDLAIETAKRYKTALEESGRTGLFVFMSSMIVYGDSAPYGEEKVVDRHTVPTPANFYGDSKWQADNGIRSLADETMNVAIIRPPMIYGKGSKGNYPTLSKLARKLPVFPDVENSRSMLYMGNLCEFLSGLFLSTVSSVDSGEEKTAPNALIFMPQNGEYTKTSSMVKAIAKTVGHRISVVKVLNPAVVLAEKVPGKVGGLVDKAFGNNCYDQGLSEYSGLDYQKYSLERSIKLTEGMESSINQHSPLISVVMATFNDKPKFINQAIQSILDQTYSNFELLILDDSTDEDTKETIDSFNDPRIRVIRGNERLGFVPSLNKGLDLAKGDYIARMDGDDISDKDRFLKEVNFLNLHQGIDVVGGQISIIDENGNITGERNYPLGGLKLLTFFTLRTPVAHPTAMFRRKIIDKGFRYDESLKKAEDIDFWIRLYNAGYHFANVKDKVLKFRVESDFMEKRVNNKDQESYVLMIRRKNFSLKHPFFSTVDYLMTYAREFYPDSLKRKIYNSENKKGQKR